jgi:hypothetical protein
MPRLSNREKRTIRFAAVGLLLYLALFYGVAGWKKLEVRRAEYTQLRLDAQRLKRDLQRAENRVLLAQKLKENFHLDPRKLAKNSLVAETSAAIQNAAKAANLQLGPVRESAARPSAREASAMQFEGVGPVPAVLGLLHRLEGLGYPIIVDALQLTPDNTKPGMVKFNVSIVILDFEQWKKAEAPDAA